jgi:YbbR domain-containing protein
MIRLLKKDLGIKILALCIAILMWGFVHSLDQNPSSQNIFAEQTFAVVPQVQNTGAGLQLITELKTVNVRVRGKNNLLSLLQKNDLQAFIDLSGIEEGRHTVPIQVSLSSGYELVSINPSQVELQLDRVVTRQIPVAVELIGETVDGYSADKPVFKPTEVLVTGPSSVVANLAKGVVNVAVDQLTSSLSGTLPVQLVDLAGQTVEGLKVEPAIIDVFLPIMQSMPTKQVPVKVRLSGEPNPSYKIVNWVIEPSFIQVTGSVEYLKELEAINTKSVSVVGATGDVVRDVDLVIPEGYSSASSQRVRVLIKIEPKLERKTIGGITIKIKNLAEGHNADLDKNTVSLVLEGRPDLLGGTVADNIEAWVDLGGMTEGENTTPVQVSLPEGLKLISREPQEIKALIKKE